VNPKRAEIEGVNCHPAYAELPEKPDAVIVALALQVTETVVSQLIAQGAPLIRLPPECFADAAVEACEGAGVPCVSEICPAAALATLKRLGG
jgi:predicted CoA-binding protein